MKKSKRGEEEREEKEFEQRSGKWEKKKEWEGGCGVMRRSLGWFVEVSVCVTQFQLIVPDSLRGSLRQSLKPFLILLLHVQFSDPSF